MTQTLYIVSLPRLQIRGSNLNKLAMSTFRFRYSYISYFKF